MPTKLERFPELEGIRGLAAIYVVIHHFFGLTELNTLAPELLRFPFRFGQEAVIVFFLLSGFVVRLSFNKQPNLSFASYLSKRASRIYPVFLLSMGLAFLVYLLNKKDVPNHFWIELVGNLLMLQDTGSKPGLIVHPFLENHALWSLSYEWWFYMLFFPITKLFRKCKYKIPEQITIVTILSLGSWFAYLYLPNHLWLITSYFVLWWAGVSLADIYIQNKKVTLSLSDLLPVIFCLGVLLIATFVPLFSNQAITYDVNAFPILPIRHFGFAILVVVSLPICLRFKREVIISKILSIFSKAAPISYGLYCVHFPILELDFSNIKSIPVVLVIKIVLIVIVSYSFEKLSVFLVKRFSSNTPNCQQANLPRQKRLLRTNLQKLRNVRM